MVTMIRNVLLGVGVSAVGNFAYWLHGQTKDLPEEQKGDLPSRVKEVAGAFCQSRKMILQGSYAAQHHVDLVASLSSRKFTVANDRAEKERSEIATSYYAGYIPNALSQNVASPIFRYASDLQVLIPIDPSKRYKGFIFAGTAGQIHDAEARDSILKGNYVRCQDGLTILDPNAERWERYSQVDVLVTGTTNHKKCRQFTNAFLRDLAFLAARPFQQIDPKLPYTDTPVLYCSSKGLKETGDLSDMPDYVKEEILAGELTVCDFYALQKTRLSRERYKRLEAVIAGTSSKEACMALHFERQQEIVEEIAKLRKQKD